MPASKLTRSVAAAGLMAAFTQLATAQQAQADETATTTQNEAKTSDEGGVLDVLLAFYDRLFDSQNH